MILMASGRILYRRHLHIMKVMGSDSSMAGHKKFLNMMAWFTEVGHFGKRSQNELMAGS